MADSELGAALRSSQAAFIIGMDVSCKWVQVRPGEEECGHERKTQGKRKELEQRC